MKPEVANLRERGMKKEDVAVKEPAGRKRVRLPAKGTAARALRASGLWSHLTPEEIERVKREIFTSRRSAA